MAIQYCKSSLGFLKRIAKTSLRKKMISASTVPRWQTRSNIWSGAIPKIVRAICICVEELTGKNSVSPWMIPRRIEEKMFDTAIPGAIDGI